MFFENATKVGEGAPPTGKADAAARRLREYAADWSGFECADGERVQQAVLNLIATAREATARDDANFESFYFSKVLQGGCFCCLCRSPTEQLGLSVPSTGAGEISLPNLAQDQVQAVEEQ
jgi:hypothetical protein